MRKTLSFLVGAVALSAASLYAPDARAGALDACGDIWVDAAASCEILVEGGCKAECTPPAFTAVCAVENTLSCSGSCDADVDVECTASCQGGCEAECNVDPGSFDCQASCEGSCSGDCSARCSADPDSAECEASCKATCSAECDASCDIDPGSVDCVAQCSACCDGECRADINMDCQIGCQGDLYADCKLGFQGGCETQCEAPEGALFCDGQFVEVTKSNLDGCVNALRDLLDIEVEFEAEGSASGSVRCSVGEEPTRGAAALFGFGLLCLASIRRRR